MVLRTIAVHDIPAYILTYIHTHSLAMFKIKQSTCVCAYCKGINKQVQIVLYLPVEMFEYIQIHKRTETIDADDRQTSIGIGFV